MSTPPFIPSGPLPSFDFKADAEAEPRGARPSRALVVASRDDELPDTNEATATNVAQSASQRDAATNARDGRAPQSSERVHTD